MVPQNVSAISACMLVTEAANTGQYGSEEKATCMKHVQLLSINRLIDGFY